MQIAAGNDLAPTFAEIDSQNRVGSFDICATTHEVKNRIAVTDYHQLPRVGFRSNRGAIDDPACSNIMSIDARRLAHLTSRPLPTMDVHESGSTIYSNIL